MIHVNGMSYLNWFVVPDFPDAYKEGLLAVHLTRKNHHIRTGGGFNHQFKKPATIYLGKLL